MVNDDALDEVPGFCSKGSSVSTVRGFAAFRAQSELSFQVFVSIADPVAALPILTSCHPRHPFHRRSDRVSYGIFILKNSIQLCRR